MLPRTPTKALILLLLTLNFITESQSWRRRRCSSVSCRVSSWSTWSQCSALQCGTLGNQQRTRRVITNPSCGGASCPSKMVDKRICYGNTPINCQVSSWSSWSVRSTVQCGKSGFEQRSRYIIRHSNCGGSACPSALQETRICYGTKALHVSIPHGRHGARVQHSGACGDTQIKQAVDRFMKESNVGEHHVISRP